MIKVIVIDDELYARDELNQLLEETGEVEVIASCSNAIEGIKEVNRLKPDAIFLDIQMPQITGLEMISMLDQKTMPKVVFVTAYDEFALKAFEDNAFDYLLKPVDCSRLEKTINRLKLDVKVDLSSITPDKLELVPCTGFQRIILLDPAEIEIAFSDSTGVHINSAQKSCTTTPLTLKTLDEKTNLFRCHRQYLVNLSLIRTIKLLDNGLAEIHTINNYKAPVSRRYLKTLKERFCLSQ